MNKNEYPYMELEKMLEHFSYACLLETIAEIAIEDRENLGKHCTDVGDVIANAACDIRTALQD